MRVVVPSETLVPTVLKVPPFNITPLPVAAVGIALPIPNNKVPSFIVVVPL